MEWLYRSDSDTLTTIAVWSIVVVLATTLVLLIYTLGLRAATVLEARRRRQLLARWRDLFAMAILDERAARKLTLPPLRRGDRIHLLEEWNRARSIVDGDAIDNLILLGRRAGIHKLATRLLRSHRTQSQILAVQTIGHLRSRDHRDVVREFLDHKNTALSVTAAAALVDIDPEFGVSAIIPMINRRRDWPKTRVFVVLRLAGSARISEPLYRAIRSADDAGKTYLLGFARLMEGEILDALVKDLLRESNNAGVLNAALKLVTGFTGVPRIAAFTRHEVWFVRMQAAKVLGHVGQQEHLPLLESLLNDREWWVRYRAAQAITSLPFLGPNELRKLRQQQTDRYAVDILAQSYAEAGLA